MAQTIDSKAERYLRYSHRNMMALLVLTIVVGSLLLTMALRPGDVPSWMASSIVLLAVAITIGLAALQKATLKGGRWDAKLPEVQAVLQDEWRRTNMDRAIRVAFVVVLAAQIPIGLLFSRLPSLRAVMAMAAATMMLGMSAFISLFLFFAREPRDG